MYKLDVENKTIAVSKTLSGELARHLLTRVHSGRIAVVCESPTSLICVVRKQWQKIIRQKERERSSTLGEHRAKIENELEYLRSIAFTAQPPIEDPLAMVSFATIEQFLQAPPLCRTLYLTVSTEKHNQYLLTAWMPPGGLVVVYGRK